MMAQIPLPWHLTDLLCAMGLGFAYSAVYALLRRILHRSEVPCTGVFAPRPRQRRLQKRCRKYSFMAGEAIFAALCVLFTRAWVLTGSHAAQFRLSMAAGLAAGCAAYFYGVQPVLRRWVKMGLHAVAPLLRLYTAVNDFFHRRSLARRERRRLVWEKRQKKRAELLENRLRAAAQAEKRNDIEKSKKDLQENPQKELQNPAQIYYNNL
ncbi:MAG: hypothetical protein IJ412_03505 [Oscillospiraceae bacterium]|nr:hypothetical protein [Oscillospiraceae bacterium]